MKTFLISTALVALAAANPAQAQLLGGGGGLGGMIGGTLNGQGSIAGPLRAPIESVRSATRGTVDATAKAKGSKSIDRRSGKVAADGSADAGIAGTVSHAAQAPTSSFGGTSTASGSASGSGSASAQLIGTDQVRSAMNSTVATATGVTLQAKSTAGGAAGTASNIAGGAAGTAQGSANQTTGLAAGQISAAGSAAAQANGAFAIAGGTPVSDPDGNMLGTVSEVFADAHGRVDHLLVNVDGKTAMLPAGNFSASGDALVSTMSRAELGQVAEQQAEEPAAE